MQFTEQHRWRRRRRWPLWRQSHFDESHTLKFIAFEHCREFFLLNSISILRFRWFIFIYLFFSFTTFHFWFSFFHSVSFFVCLLCECLCVWVKQKLLFKQIRSLQHVLIIWFHSIGIIQSSFDPKQTKPIQSHACARFKTCCIQLIWILLSPNRDV